MKSFNHNCSIGNILLDSNFQSNPIFVICDFGFADFTDEAGRQFVAGMKKPTVQGITIRYAAPEVNLLCSQKMILPEFMIIRC